MRAPFGTRAGTGRPGNAVWMLVAVFLFISAGRGSATESPDAPSPAPPRSAPPIPTADRLDPDDSPAVVQYPFSVAADGTTLYMVDLHLPGVWRIRPSGRDLYFRGTRWLRRPMNSPRPVCRHPSSGGLLVGDSATREVYHVRADKPPVPLCRGGIGIPMAIAVAPDGASFYVGDAEKFATFRVPVGGGECTLVARVNARGLAFDSAGHLWAVTPDADAVVRIDVSHPDADANDPEQPHVTAVVTDRPYGFPNGLVWAGDHGFVVDVYEKAIWKFTPDGATEKWVADPDFISPNGIAINDDSVFVTDPRAKQLFEFNRQSKKRTDRLADDAFTRPTGRTN